MSADLPITATAAGVRLPVRVIPRSPRDGIDGVRDGRLVLRLTAPPVDNEANGAAVRLLAETFGVPRAAIRLAAGRRQRNKVFEIAGLTVDRLQQALGTKQSPGRGQKKGSGDFLRKT